MTQKLRATNIHTIYTHFPFSCFCSYARLYLMQLLYIDWPALAIASLMVLVLKNGNTILTPHNWGRMLGEQWDVRNFGLGGRTLLRKGDHPYWKEEALQQAYAFQPTEVVIALGTNDTKPQNWVFKAEFQQDLKDLAQSFLDLESHPRLWLAFPPPAFPGRWGIRERKIRKELIPIIRSTAQELDVPLINFYDAMIHHEALFPDTVHPNAEGAACMARTVYAALRKELFSLGKGPTGIATPAMIFPAMDGLVA